MNSQLPPTGTEDFFELLSRFVPDDYLNERWPRLQTGGRRHHFSAAQLWRLHLLALITPVHSFNLLVRLLPEQKAWRRFARLRNLAQLPDVRMMNAFRKEVGVCGLREVNSHLLDPLIENLDPTRPALALIDATDLPAACSGFKKKHGPLFRRRCRFGWTHPQERTKPVFCRLQEAYLPPLGEQISPRSLVGAVGHMVNSSQCFRERPPGAQSGLLRAALGLAARIRGRRHGLSGCRGQTLLPPAMAGESHHPCAGEDENGAPVRIRKASRLPPRPAAPMAGLRLAPEPA